MTSSARGLIALDAVPAPDPRAEIICPLDALVDGRPRQVVSVLERVAILEEVERWAERESVPKGAVLVRPGAVRWRLPRGQRPDRLGLVDDRGDPAAFARRREMQEAGAAAEREAALYRDARREPGIAARADSRPAPSPRVLPAPKAPKAPRVQRERVESGTPCPGCGRPRHPSAKGECFECRTRCACGRQKAWAAAACAACRGQELVERIRLRRAQMDARPVVVPLAVLPRARASLAERIAAKEAMIAELQAEVRSLRALLDSGPEASG